MKTNIVCYELYLDPFGCYKLAKLVARNLLQQKYGCRWWSQHEGAQFVVLIYVQCKVQDIVSQIATIVVAKQFHFSLIHFQFERVAGLFKKPRFQLEVPKAFNVFKFVLAPKSSISSFGISNEPKIFQEKFCSFEGGPILGGGGDKISST